MKIAFGLLVLHLSLTCSSQTILLAKPTTAQLAFQDLEPWNVCFAFMAYLGLRTSEAVGVA